MKLIHLYIPNDLTKFNLRVNVYLLDTLTCKVSTVVKSLQHLNTLLSSTSIHSDAHAVNLNSHCNQLDCMVPFPIRLLLQTVSVSKEATSSQRQLTVSLNFGGGILY